MLSDDRAKTYCYRESHPQTIGGLIGVDRRHMNPGGEGRARTDRLGAALPDVALTRFTGL